MLADAARRLLDGHDAGGVEDRLQRHRGEVSADPLGAVPHGRTIPFLAERLDRGFHAFADCRQHIDRPPSEHFKHFYYDTVNFDPRALKLAVDFAGAEHVLAERLPAPDRQHRGDAQSDPRAPDFGRREGGDPRRQRDEAASVCEGGGSPGARHGHRRGRRGAEALATPVLLATL
jgi:hypothetical protein